MEEVSLVAQMVKRLPTMQETQVRSLGREDPLEKEIATHSSTLAWKIPWMEEPGRLQSMGSQRVRHDWVTSLHFTYMEVIVCLNTLYKNSNILHWFYLDCSPQFKRESFAVFLYWRKYLSSKETLMFLPIILQTCRKVWNLAVPYGSSKLDHWYILLCAVNVQKLLSIVFSV